jgi:hypothetical protein
MRMLSEALKPAAITEAVPTATGFVKTNSTASLTTTAMGAINTFQDLDLSGIVGARSALVLLKVLASATATVVFKTHGGTGTTAEWQGTGGNAGGCSKLYLSGAAAQGYAVLMTDSGGLVEVSADSTALLTITVVGFVN